MSTENQTSSSDSTELARKAINHVLAQIRNNPDVRYHMGACTESFELLKKAHSALNGISEDAIEEETFIPLKRISASERIDDIREMADDHCDGAPDANGTAKLANAIAKICRE